MADQPGLPDRVAVWAEQWRHRRGGAMDGHRAAQRERVSVGMSSGYRWSVPLANWVPSIRQFRDVGTLCPACYAPRSPAGSVHCTYLGLPSIGR